MIRNLKNSSKRKLCNVLFLLPACILVGFVVATAIPSMAGMSAAVGPTLIPLLVRAGFRPAMAAAAVASCVMAGYFNPGVSHNPFIAKLAGMEVMEFVGEGVGRLSVEYRNGIDVMTTETTCLSSIWETDDKVAAWYKAYGREGDFKPLRVPEGADIVLCFDDAAEISAARGIVLPLGAASLRVTYGGERAEKCGGEPEQLLAAWYASLALRAEEICVKRVAWDQSANIGVER